MSVRIYLDHAATTPMSGAVVAAMAPYADSGNPSSLHAEGRAARAAVERARTAIAGCLGAKPREIVFTSGGSEANNLAIIGGAQAGRQANPSLDHVVTVATEHHAVLHAVEVLRHDGFAITILPVNDVGRVDPAAFARALRPQTILAAVMLANNEIGTVQPIAELARSARAAGVRFHTDAVQAPGRVPLDVALLDVDSLALSAHKCAGPKGVGALYVRAGYSLAAQVVGGSQEAGRRAGTENVMGVVGFARALADATASSEADSSRLRALRARFESVVLATIADVRINGAGAARVPHIVSVAFAGVTAFELLVALDLAGVAVSTGSACAAGSPEPSHVVAALAAPAWVRAGTIRFSLSGATSDRDLDEILTLLPGIVGRLRVASRDLGTSPIGSFTSLPEVRS